MRIAYLCADPGVPVFGTKGCSVHVQEGIRALLGQEAQVTLFASRLGGTPPADLEAVPVHRLPRLPKGDAAARERAALAANDDLASLLEREGPFDLVYERYALWSYAGMAHARKHRIPGVLEVNAPLIDEQARHRRLVDRESAEWVASRVFSTASVLLAVSREVAAYVATYPDTRGRIHVVPNGVNPERFRPGVVPTAPAPPGTFTVGFVGSLKPWHGLAHLAEAFTVLHRYAPATRLLIVGDGPERDRLEAALSQHGVADAALFTGAVLPEKVPGLIASMDVAVAPYPKQAPCYFSPLKIFEYMASEVPVIASRVGQISEVIEDRVSGLLCPPGDEGALVTALIKLWREPALRARLAEAARARIVRDHTWEATARRVLHLAGFEPAAQPRGAEAGV
ncbi:MAG: glycosyltransferase family 4 protein [Rhodothermales bacterium]